MNETDRVKNARDRLIIALDFAEAGHALDLVGDLSGDVSCFKIGLQLYTAAGPDIVHAIIDTDARVFLDLKLHDIPNTVAKAVEAAAKLEVEMLTIHLSGGRQMIETAVAACPAGLLLLGVTVLTSSDEETLRETGVAGHVQEQTNRLAALGASAGIRGLIASPHEVPALRSQLGSEMLIVTPGVRPTGTATHDQKRFTTPREALENGADRLVIGRPVTAHAEPREALRQIIEELAS